jgi:hypothetical protein
VGLLRLSDYEFVGGASVRRITLTVAVGCLAASAALTGAPKGDAAPLSHGVVVRMGAATTPVLHSENWSGYAVTGETYTQVAGSWSVPTVVATPGRRYASDWVGIGGFDSDDLIQAGTTEQYVNGHATYNAWTEILPASELIIPGFTVHPGDAITVTVIKGSGKSWTMTVSDSTESESFSRKVNYSSSENSAEWIHEAPEVGGSIVDIASTSNVDFDHGTVNGSTVIGSAGTLTKIVLAGYLPGDTKATPSKLDSDKDGFAVADGTKAPKPPAS